MNRLTNRINKIFNKTQNETPEEIGINIELPNEIIYKEIKPKVFKTNNIKILKMIDEPVNKKVTVFTDIFDKIVLWEGSAYDAIGQWTDEDVKNKIIETINQE
jgi:hypothetical protein